LVNFVFCTAIKEKAFFLHAIGVFTFIQTGRAGGRTCKYTLKQRGKSSCRSGNFLADQVFYPLKAFSNEDIESGYT
jgi:hypothetical protein